MFYMAFNVSIMSDCGLRFYHLIYIYMSKIGARYFKGGNKKAKLAFFFVCLVLIIFRQVDDIRFLSVGHMRN